VRRGTPFDAALAEGLRTLGEPDRRLAHELAAGVLRHEAALDAIIAPFLRSPKHVSPPLHDILRLGAYQLHYLDRIPPHAVVATAVSLSRVAVGEKSTGFVNAILRRVASAAPEAAPPDPDGATALAAAHSHPAWLVERWIARWGTDDTRRLLEWNNTRSTLVVQPCEGSVDELHARFAREGVRAFPAPYGAGLVVETSRPEQLPGFDAGLFYVQDPAQALVVRYLGAAPGDTVLDACAAPGGKSLGLARTAAWVIAADVSRRRLQRLRENLRRTAAGNVVVLLADAAAPATAPMGQVLLDAPCLGTGTFARHPDARLRVSHAALSRLAAEQSRLLDALADRVVAGGVLTYATCSLEPEENAQQVEAFLRRRPDFRRNPPEGTFPRNPEGDLESLPHRDGMDGAYAARLVRTASA
jgi:16S rRNA (cytosine967-C5)-methyltransferase